jgi:putative ABC transport system permease protein
MMMGIGLLELVNLIIGDAGSTGAFKNPGVDLQLVITALIVMIVSGAVAGLLPALRAVAIRPVDALRSDG